MIKGLFYYMLGIATVLIITMLIPQTQAILEIDTPLHNNQLNFLEAPQNHINQHQIKVYTDRALIELEGLKWATFKETNSMKPTLDHNSHALQIEPKCPEQIDVGDIISYKTTLYDGIIIHRVIEKSYDSEGVYFIAQGDNNVRPDPERIRCDQIDRKVVAIIY